MDKIRFFHTLKIYNPEAKVSKPKKSKFKEGDICKVKKTGVEVRVTLAYGNRVETINRNYQHNYDVKELIWIRHTKVS